MARKLRKTLPKDFRDILASGDLDRMKAVFDSCQLDATGGYSKDSALSTYGVPDELVRWLVSEGADLHFESSYGETPLHHHAGAWNGNPALLLELGAEVDRVDSRGETPLFGAMSHPAHVQILVGAGADVNAENSSGDTPLMYALRRCRNADIRAVADAAAVVLGAGATTNDEMREHVRRIGHEFEFSRDGFNPEFLDETDAGLRRLYELFGVTPAPRHVRHDGVSPIVATGEGWRARHADLWEFLVPPSGPAPTVQGEVVRVTGRIADEIIRNGGANWDTQYRAMLSALPGYAAVGEPLSLSEAAELATLAAGFRRGMADDEELDRIRELAVHWVDVNPTPIRLDPPSYSR